VDLERDMSASHLNVLATHTALPPNRLEREDVERAFRGWLAGQDRDLQVKALRILRSAGVDGRHSFLTLQEIFTPCSLTESCARYRRHAIDLGTAALARALEKAGVVPRDLDILITTSCTGYMIPSVDAYMADRLGMRPDLIRLPVTEMGCAAGASALIYAAQMLRGLVDRTAAVVNIEFPTNTMQHTDFSMDNIVGTALFSDGIACTILRCERTAGACVVRDWAMHQVSETTGILGYHLTSTGLRMNLDASLPEVIRESLHAATATMLARNGLTLERLEHFVIHPGGVKILDHIQSVLEPFGGSVESSRGVMRRFGNMSSSTVVFILDELLRSGPTPGPALMMSFGPGFGAHQILLGIGRQTTP
jgi:alkylresorcinol/alkylpyrone synthase